MDSIYNDLESTFWKRQAAQEDARQGSLKFERENFVADAKVPQQLAETGLAKMVADKDQRLLPQQETIAKQDLMANENFNYARQMYSLVDDRNVPDDEATEMIKRGIMAISGIKGQPTLDQAKEVARASYLAQTARQNPTGFKKYLEDQMNTFSKTVKSTQGVDLVRERGQATQTNTLLRENIRLGAKLAGADIKTYEHAKVRDMLNLRAAGKHDEANAIEAGLEDWKREAAGLAGAKLTQTPGYDIGEGKVKPKDAPKRKPIPVGVVPAPVPAKETLNVGGKDYQVVRKNSDGSAVVMVDGKERTVKQK